MSYTVYGDLLYWDVRRTDLDYQGKNYDRKYVNPDYDFGWRIGATLYCDCWDFGIRYTSYDQSESKKDVDKDKVKYDIDYDVVDLEFGYKCCFNCKDVNFRPYLGVKLAWIDEVFRDGGGEGNDKGSHDMDAYGLYLGMEGRWAFCDNYAFVVRGSFGIMDAEIDNDDEESKRKHEDIYVNYDNIFVGLDVSLCDRFCYDSNFLIGWEMENWKSVKRFEDSDAIANLGLGGLVVRFALNF